MLVTNELSALDSAQRYRLINFKAQEYRIAKVWQRFESAGFNPILIKGWAVAVYYPNPWEREFVDADLVFAPGEFSAAEEFVRGQRFEIQVDIHCGPRHLDSLSFEKLWENSVIKQCGGATVRVLSEEDHLRVLCIHWLNDGGADRQRLWDIVNTIEYRSPDFDWEKCLGVINSKRRRWVVCAIGVAYKYLGLKLINTPLDKEIQNLPKWLIRSIEKEWADDVRLFPLESYRYDKKGMWKQIKKRFPPNAVTATILMEGDFDRYPRFIFQYANLVSRLIPLLKSFKSQIFGRVR